MQNPFHFSQTVITTRLAKRAKVMFLQVCVIHSVQWRGEGRRSSSTPMAIYTPPPGTRSEHFPPRTKSEHLPPPPGAGQNVYALPPEQVRMSSPPSGPCHNVYPLPPRSRSQCLPPAHTHHPQPGQNIYPLPPPWEQVRTSPPPQRLHAGRAVLILLQCILV